jgi:drug/metabolite transporter (DMT)-like permease
LEIIVAGILLVMFAAALWAADTLFRYPLLENNSTLQIVFFEHLVLVVCVLGLAVAKPSWRFKYQKGTLFGFLLIGLFGSVIGTLAFTKAFSLMNPTIVILLQKLQPIVAISLSVILLKEKISKHFIWCAIISLSGSVLMIAPDIVALSHSDSLWYYNPAIAAILLGYGCALLAVCAWGASTVYGRKLTLSGYNSVQIMTGRFGIAFVALTMLMLFNGESFTLHAGDEMNLLYMVLLSGLIGMFVYYKGLERIPARFGTLAELFFPVAAVGLNWWLLDISLTSYQMVGAALLIGGTLLMSSDPARKLEQQQPELAPA